MAKRKFIPEIIQAHLETFASQGLVPLFEQGVAIQEAVLEDIIRLSSKSWYAKDHGFFGIQNKEEFFAKVPISDYGDYAPYVESNMQRDEGQVSEAETAYYLLSTGRKKQGKYYIETALGSQARQLSIHLWNINLMRCEPKMTQPDVKMLAVTNCAPIEHAPNGKNVRRTSSQAAKELWEETPELYIFPYEFLEADMSNDDRDYLTALYALKEKHLNMLFCNNLGYFGVILDIIEKNAERLISDIAEGRMSVALKPEDRQQLEGMLGADPARAEQLRRLLWERGRLVAEDIWPDFFFTGAWLAGTVGDYARDVMAKLPASMRYISESYGCSEGMLNIPLAYNAKYGPLAVYSCYFEFLPLKNIMGGVIPYLCRKSRTVATMSC